MTLTLTMTTWTHVKNGLLTAGQRCSFRDEADSHPWVKWWSSEPNVSPDMDTISELILLIAYAQVED